MIDPRIHELEVELLKANAAVARLTQANAELTERVQASELAFKRARRNARQDGNTLREEISALQNRRG